MYILKNALRSIARAKGRNILIGIIALIIAVSACVALSIRQSAETAREDTLSSLNVTAQISLDRNAMMATMSGEGQGSFDRDSIKEMLQGAGELTLGEYEKYAAADSVDSTYYSMSASLDATGELEPIDTMGTFEHDEETDSSTTKGNMQAPSMSGRPGGFAGMRGSQGDFTVIGYSGDDAMTDFKNGNASISAGVVFTEGTEEYDCIISTELATYNNLSVGSQLTLANPNDAEETFTFNVVGTYTQNADTDTSGTGGFSTASDSANRIYMSYNALEKLISASKENAEEVTDERTGLVTTTAVSGQLSYTYVFSDVSAFEEFKEETVTLGLDEKYSVSSQDVTAFEQSLTPLDNLSRMASYFLLVVFAIGAVILVVINIFSIREKKYEIGVLTSIGMKKYKVATQFITELFAVTLAAIVLGAGIGAAASVPVTNALLASQIEANRAENSALEQNFGRDSGAGRGGMMQFPGAEGGEMSPDMQQGNRPGGIKGFLSDTTEYISKVSYSTNLTVILQLIGVGIALTLISSLAAVLFIMRYEPLKILSNRD